MGSATIAVDPYGSIDSSFVSKHLHRMSIFSYHLVETTPATTAQVFCRPPTKEHVPGLCHAECMAAMTLGAPILSPARLQLKNLAVFAAWESPEALGAFLTDTTLGRTLSTGWHVRLELLRRWGKYSEFDHFPTTPEDSDPDQPVIAVTLARLKLPEVFRFIHWGKPVEELVRDHPGTTLALTATRPFRTFSTFSVWRSQREMTEMVSGKGAPQTAGNHAKAMVERERKDFHHKFTTLRFRTISEHGAWKGKTNIVPKRILPQNHPSSNPDTHSRPARKSPPF